MACPLRALVAAGLLAGAGRALCAQNIQVTGIQGVTFGSMLPGVSKIVSRSDGLNGARFDIKGAGNTRTVELQFTLPAMMSGPGGATLPLSYTAGDAGFSGILAFRDEPGLAPAAFRLEWADGRADFDPEATFGRMTEALKSALAAEAGHAETLNGRS